jgi:hypothetical protein
VGHRGMEGIERLVFYLGCRVTWWSGAMDGSGGWLSKMEMLRVEVVDGLKWRGSRAQSSL